MPFDPRPIDVEIAGPPTIIQWRLANLRAALLEWLLTPPHLVMPGLAGWRCDSLACFGGHLPQWKHFQELGVYADEVGSPALPGCHDPYLVAGYLFGDQLIVSSRRDGYSTCATDHEIVTGRILRRIRALERS